MTEKISLSLYLDGTGNNKTNDSPTGTTTNVAKLHDLQQTDFVFDFSKNGSRAIDELKISNEFTSQVGDIDAFSYFLKELEEQESEYRTNENFSMKIYHDGVGSQVDKESFEARAESAFGVGTEPRAEKMADAIEKLKAACPDAEIELNITAFSRGAASAKSLLNELSKRFPDDDKLSVSNLILFDTVAALANPKDETHTGHDLGYPSIVDENTQIVEFISSNEYRDTFPLTPYQNENVVQIFCPGAHAQVGGGYFNDILAVGPLVQAFNRLSSEGQNLIFDKLSTDDIVKLRLYNAIIDNPLIVRALITDSRIKSDDLAIPGQTNEPFPGQIPQEGEFSEHPDERIIIDERDSLSKSQLEKSFIEIGNSLTMLFNPEYAEQEMGRLEALQEKYNTGDESVVNIAKQNFQKVDASNGSDKLPAELEALVKSFENNLDQLEYNPEDLYNPLEFDATVAVLQEAFSQFQHNLDLLQELAQADGNVSTGLFTEDMIRNMDVMEARLEYLRENGLEDQTGDRLRDEALFANLENTLDLQNAFDSRDGITILQSLTDFLIGHENTLDKFDFENRYNVHAGLQDKEESGFLTEQSESLLQIASQGFSILDAIRSDDDIQALRSGLSLLQGIDSYLEDPDAYNTQMPASASDYYQGFLASIADGVLGVSHGLMEGDDLEASIAALDLLKQLSNSDYFGEAAAVLRLYQDIADFEDVLETGSAADIGMAAARLSYDAVTTYNTLSTYTDSLQAVNGYASYLGYAAGAFQILSGDTQGGCEQIALTYICSTLYTIPVYGWAAALALQLASATRYCDGQLIDTDNIEEFSEEYFPEAALAVKWAIAEIELPSELASKGFEISSYMTGFNIEMFEDLGVEIPEEWHGELNFAQTLVDAANGGRYAEYIKNLDNLSLADVWDSLYISQIISAGIEQIKGVPDFLESHIKDGPEVIVDLAEMYLDPGTVCSLAKHAWNTLFGDPDEASASFSVDENGQVVMNVGGDSSMKAQAKQVGSPMIDLMQQYLDGGGRLVIDGTLPSVKVVDGGSSQIVYGGAHGGRISVDLGDMSDAFTEMQGVLYARDRGERLDTAVNLSTSDAGSIDFAAVDSILAGYGFSREGITYTYGETGSRTGTSTGSGVYRGGGNDGPEGQRFVAKSSDFKSLPVPPDQLPSQRMGDIAKIISANNMFSGYGAELLAMALVLPGGLPAPAVAGRAGQADALQLQYLKPLTAAELESFYMHDHNTLTETEPAATVPLDKEQIQSLNSDLFNWLYKHPDGSVLERYQGLLNTAEDGTEHFSTIIENVDSPSEGSHVPWWTVRWSDVLLRQTDMDKGPDPAEASPSSRSFSGYRLTADQVEAEGFSAAAPPGAVANGPVFMMAEDSILRFLPSELAEDSAVGTYGNSEEASTFVSFGRVSNGRVWQEPGGDIRFQPTPGFVGTGSFTYTVENGDGILEERTALVQVKNVNDYPQPHNDAFTLHEGQTLSLDLLLANDSDPDGDQLTIDHFRGVTHGEITLQDGRLAFIPEEGYFGDIEFSYWVRDHLDVYPVPANVRITYLDLDYGVSAGSDRFLVRENDTLTTSTDILLANDIEHDGQAFSFEGIERVDHGTVVVADDGAVTFTPDRDYSGTDAGFSYLVKDETGNNSSGYAAVEVVNVRNAPVIISDSIAPVPEDEIVAFTPDQVALFAADADGDSLHLSLVENAAGGTFTIRDGYYAFVPDSDYVGPASFDYTVSDNHGGTAEGHLEFSIFGVNDPVTAAEDSAATGEDRPVVVTIADLLANDADVDGTAITFVGLGNALNGSAAAAADGSITFDPDPDYYGDEAGFEYVVEDDAGLRSSGWVRISVTPENDGPRLISSSLTTQEDRAVTFDAVTLATLMEDVDGDSLSVLRVDNPTGGVVEESGGLFLFRPFANFHGTGSASVTVSDGNGKDLTADIELQIESVDDPTDFGGDDYSTLEETPVVTTVADLIANDSDADGALEFLSLGESFNGTASIDDSGEITFLPDPDYAGSDAGFTYLVQDAEGHRAQGRVVVRVDNVNDIPVITGNSMETAEDAHVVFDAGTISRFIQDPDGDTITLVSVQSSPGGRVETDGATYTFIPDQDYHGPAIIEYRATDGRSNEISGTLNLDILSVDDPTLFGEDLFDTVEETPLTITVSELLANDSDRDGNGGLSYVGVDAPMHGQVYDTGGGTITFIPDPDYYGEQAGFSYLVRDDEGNESTGVVSIRVENSNDPPEITGNRLFIKEDDTLAFTGDELAKFLFDGDGDLFHMDMVANVEGGRVEIINGSYTFIPDQDYYGEASLDYVASNSGGEQVASHLEIGILPVNDLPDIQPFSTTGAEDHEVVLAVADLMSGCSDVEDGSALKFAGIDSAANGDVYLDDDFMLHFLPYRDFFGSASFYYNVVDSEGGIGKGLVSIELAGENDAPEAHDDERILAWSNNLYDNIFSQDTFLANDYDADGDSLVIESVGSATFGTVSIDGSGLVHYIAPAADWTGIDHFSYRIADGNGGFDEARAEIEVKVNTSPDVYPEILFTSEDIVSLLAQENLLANDSDIDEDSFRIIAVDQPQHCSVELTADGSILFTPELNYNNLYPEQACFRYTVSDGISDPVSGIAYFDIDPVNDSPILTPETISGAVEDNSFSFHAAALISNDSDVEMASPYEQDSIRFTGVWGAGHGNISHDPDTGDIHYVPNANFCGTETFEYGVVDSYGLLSVITSRIYVQPVNDIPVVQEDIGSAAEEYVWNYYSISSLVANDYDVDGDSLTISNPRIVSGRGDVAISGGNLAVKPDIGEDRLVIDYTVSDGHGGDVQSRLTIPRILEHNFAPKFTGLYCITHRLLAGYDTIFSFQSKDQNGGDSWTSDLGDIVSVNLANLRTNYPSARMNKEAGYNDHFRFRYNFYLLDENTDYYATFTITAVDHSGATGTIFVDFEKMQKTVGPIFTYQYSPVVLDLDGDGVELLNIGEGVAFDWNYDAIPDNCGWVAPDDGMLAYDYNRDGKISEANELSLKDYAPDATTDLEGLQAFDSNEDGVFDPGDDEWDQFGVWQDKNSNGISETGEFTGLDELEIASINLESDDLYQELEGNYIYGQTTYQLNDGTEYAAADAGLEGGEVSLSEEYGSGDDTIEAVTAAGEFDDETATVEEEMAEDTVDEDSLQEQIVFSDAELNRLAEQLSSDIAAHETSIEEDIPSAACDPAFYIDTGQDTLEDEIDEPVFI